MNMIVFGNGVFVDVIKLKILKLDHPQFAVVPKPSDWHPCKERELWKQTLTKREDSLVEMKTEIGVVQPRAKKDGGC